MHLCRRNIEIDTVEISRSFCTNLAISCFDVIGLFPYEGVQKIWISWNTRIYRKSDSCLDAE